MSIKLGTAGNKNVILSTTVDMMPIVEDILKW